MSNTPDRLARLLELLTLLQSGGRPSARDLAERFGVGRRTIYRDIDTLKECGIRVESEPGRAGYRIAGESLLPCTQFTLEEMLSLLILCGQLGHHATGLPFQQAARTAAGKVYSALPSRIAEEVGSLTDAISVQLDQTADLTEAESTWELFRRAVGDRLRVRILYDSYTEDRQLRTLLSPYRLLFRNRAWYVIGRSSVHRAVRTFHIGRVLEAEVLDETFEVPKSFNLDRYFGNAWRMIREKKSYRCHIRFGPLMARNVAEVVWHKTQTLDWNDDGSLDFKVTVDSLKEIVWWILGYGKHAKVLEPRELREQIAEQVRALAETYEA